MADNSEPHDDDGAGGMQPSDSVSNERATTGEGATEAQGGGTFETSGQEWGRKARFLWSQVRRHGRGVHTCRAPRPHMLWQYA